MSLQREHKQLRQKLRQKLAAAERPAPKPDYVLEQRPRSVFLQETEEARALLAQLGLSARELYSEALDLGSNRAEVLYCLSAISHNHDDEARCAELLRAGNAAPALSNVAIFPQSFTAALAVRGQVPGSLKLYWEISGWDHCYPGFAARLAWQAARNANEPRWLLLTGDFLRAIARFQRLSPVNLYQSSIVLHQLAFLLTVLLETIGTIAGSTGLYQLTRLDREVEELHVLLKRQPEMRFKNKLEPSKHPRPAASLGQAAAAARRMYEMQFLWAQQAEEFCARQIRPLAREIEEFDFSSLV